MQEKILPRLSVKWYHQPPLSDAQRSSDGDSTMAFDRTLGEQGLLLNVNRYRGLAVAVSMMLVGVTLGFVFLDLRDSWQAPAIVISDPLPGAVIAASINGAVATPGAYLLAADSRVTHLVDIAGGVTENADLAQVNLAARLRDEQQVFVPTRVPSIAAGSMPDAGKAGTPMGIVSPVDARLNINTATQAELEALPGIGPALAGLIVEERVRIGSYDSVDDLVRIPGISQRMVDELRERVTT